MSSDSESSVDHEMIVDCVAQFLKSPLWTVPVFDYIDEHCAFFGSDETGENDHQHYAIHQKFCGLIDETISTFIESLGFEAQTVIDCCRKSANPAGKHFFVYMQTLDNFQAFRALMIKRNCELELETLKQLHMGGIVPGGEGGESNMSESAQEDADMARAIAASVANDDVLRKQAEAEDAELQQALALSIQEEQERQASLREERTKRAAEELAAIKDDEEKAKKMKEQEADEAAALADAAERQKMLEAEALALRVENVKRINEGGLRGIEGLAQNGPEDKIVATSDETEEKNTSSAPVVSSKPIDAVTTSGPAPAPKLAPTAGSAKLSGGIGSLPALPAGLDPFAKAKLGGISGGQRNSVDGGSGFSFKNICESNGQSAVSAPKPTESDETEKVLKERAAHMRKQRDMIVAQRKAKRADDMKEFVTTENEGGQSKNASVKNPSAPTVDERKQLSADLIKRLRGDIVNTAIQ